MFLFKLFGFVILAGIYVESASIGKRSAEEFDVFEVFDGVKDVKVMLEKRFNETNTAVVQIAKTLEKKYEEVLGLTDTFKDQQTTITNTLATLYDMTKRMTILRVKLYALAGATIRNSDRLIRKLNKFKEGTKLGIEYKSILGTVRRLLSTADRMLTDAEKEIEKISGEMSKTQANIVVFQGIVQQAMREAERRERERYTNSTNEIIMESGDIVKDIVGSVTNGVWNSSAKSTPGDIISDVMKTLPRIIKLGTLINKVVSEEDMTEKFNEILLDLNEVVAKLKVESGNIEKERKLVVEWKNIVQIIRADWIDELDDIEVNIEVDDIVDIITDFEILKGAAQNYINHLDKLFPN